MTTFSPPPLLAGQTEQQVTDLRRYLFRLVEELNHGINSLTADNFAGGGASGSGMTEADKKVLIQSQLELKNMIIRNANAVESAIDALEANIANCATDSDLTSLHTTITGEISAMHTTVGGEISAAVSGAVSGIESDMATLETDMETEIASHFTTSGSLKIGDTTLSETQLQALIDLI